MRVGLTFDLRNPPQWFRPWDKLYRQALESVAEAEHLGADSIWVTEHHFFEDGYLPQPLTFCAAAAARTSRVRFGTAIMIAPLRAAAQIAEESAVVDLISGGRLDLGLGPGYRVPEFEAFGAGVRSRFSATFDPTSEVRRLLDGGTVTPPPVQSPLPIWLGYRQGGRAEHPRQVGEGLLRMDPRPLGPYRGGPPPGGHCPGTAG